VHGGTVEAIPLQQGVTFRISMPELAVDPPPAERPQAQRAAGTLREVSEGPEGGPVRPRTANG